MREFLRGDPSGKPLSFREWGTLICMALGYSNKQIGAEFHKELSTVKTQSMYIYQKLGAKNRAEAIAIGYQKGYLA